jgi:hypothetical protein
MTYHDPNIWTPGHQPNYVTPKKKGRGCLTALLVVAVLGTVLIIGGVIAAGMADVEAPERSFSTTTTSTQGESTWGSTPQPRQTTPTTAATSAGQDNAERKAAEYLEFTAFSRTGLIKQLKFEGFNEADATHGVDSLNADWNEQAAKKAAEYLDFQSFSRDGLVDQLVFEGFTPEQAEHGVSTTGL